MKKIVALLLSLILAFSLTIPAWAENLQEKPFENSEFFTVGDYTLHYRTFEPDTQVKNQIFLIHGFCLSSISMEPIAIEYAERGYRTVIVDVPNFGYSSRETSETQLLDREEVLYGLIENLGGTWIVGGHSMGGGIAVNLATDYPETVTGTVLFAPQTSAESNGIMAMFMRSSIMKLMYNFVIKLALMFPPIVKGLVEMSFSDKEFADNYDLSKVTAPYNIKGTGDGVAIMASHTRGSDLEAFSKLSIPCVIITAEDDRVANASNLQAIIDNAPEGAVVKGGYKGGHMMMEYSPELIAEETLPIIEMCK